MNKSYKVVKSANGNNVAVPEFATSKRGGIIAAVIMAVASTGAMAQTDAYETQAEVLAANTPEQVAQVVGVNSIAISNSYTAGGATTNGYNSIAIGVETVADKQYGIAVGNLATSTAEEGISIGSQTKASGESSVSVGSLSEASGNSSVAIGRGAAAAGETGTAVGSGAVATEKHGSAFGTDARATGIKGTAVGVHAEAAGESSIAVGPDAKSTALYSAAVGNNALATGRGSLAMGLTAVAEGGQAIAVGRSAQATGMMSVAQGSTAKATEMNAVAIGTLAEATHEGAVALGSESTTKEAVHVTEATVEGISYDTFAGVPVAVVSVGSEGKERQIVNVAPGEISETSTDAINGSQLYLVAGQVGQNATAINNNAINIAANQAKLAEHDVALQDLDYRVITNAHGIRANMHDIEVNAEAIAENADRIAINAGNIAINRSDIENHEARLKDAESTLTDHEGRIVVLEDTAVKHGNELKVHAREIQGIHATNKRQDADIKAAKTEVKAGDNVTVTEAKGANGQAVYTVSAKDTSASVSSSTDLLTVAKGKVTKVGTVDVTDYNLDLSAKAKEGIERGLTAVQTVKAGNNTTVTRKGDTVTVNAKDTKVVAGSEALTVVNKTTAPDVTTATVDLSKDSKEALAKARTALQSFMVSVDDVVVNEVNQSNPNQGFVSGKNVKLSSKDGAVVIGTADDVEFQHVVAKAFRAGDVTVSEAGINAGGNKVTNVAAGEVSATSTDAVNGSQLHATNLRIDQVENKVDGANALFGNLSNQVKDLKKEMEGGFAGLNAAASLPQAHRAGQSTVAAAVGAYGDAQALAIGVSTISDSGRWTVKGQANLNTEGKVGGGVGVAFNF